MKDLHIQLKQARQSASRQDFEAAAKIYEEVLQRDEMAGDIDMQIRLAWCHEKAGKIDNACNLYHEVIHQYEKLDMDEAAKSLHSTIDNLQRSHGKMLERPNKPLEEEALMKELIGMGTSIHLRPKEILCHAGERSHTLWLLCKGALRFKMEGYEDEPDIAYTDEKGIMLVGELGLFTLQARSATVWSQQHADLYAVPAQDIRNRQKTDPEFNAGIERLVQKRWVEPIITRQAIFERINDVHRAQIAKLFRPIELKAGQCLIDLGEEHDGAYLVQTGCLFLLNTAQDDHGHDTKLLANAMPGDFVHSNGLMRGSQSACRITAATHARLLYLSREDFEPFTHQRPWLIQALIKQSRRPPHLQVLRPDDDYLWSTNRHIQLRRVDSKDQR